MINIEAAKITAKIVGKTIGVVGSFILLFYVLFSIFDFYGILAGLVIIIISLSVKVIYETEKSKIEFKNRIKN
jgi:hypothetical protein